MPQTLTLRAGDQFVVEAGAYLDGRPVGAAVSLASADPSKVAVEQIDETRWLLKALATTGSPVDVTATCGSQTDYVSVTVISSGEVSSVQIGLIGDI